MNPEFTDNTHPLVEDWSKKSVRFPMCKLLLLSATALVGVIGLICAALIVPGTPSHSKVMAFDGYIELPKDGVLNIMDYLTLDRSSLFVTSESSGSLFKIDIDQGQPSASLVTEMRGAGAAHGVVLLPGQNVAFITRSEANMVDVFDPKTLVQLGQIPVADDVDGIHYIPSAQLIYVTNGDAKLATLIDPAKRVTVGTIQLPGKPEFSALDSHTGLLYQNLEDVDSVVSIDLAKRKIMGEWPLAACDEPSGMAIDSEQRRLFAVCSGNATLVIFDLDAHRVISSLKIGGSPDTVAYDAAIHRLYSAGKAGKLTVIQQDSPDSYRVLDEIRTHYGAHTLTFDPASHKVYVAYASLLAHPRIAVFSPQL